MARRRAKLRKIKPYRPAKRRYYGRGYSMRRSRFRALKWIVATIVACAAVFIIVSAAPAFIKLITGQLTDNTTMDVSSGYNSGASAVASSDTSSTEGAKSETQGLNTAYMPVELYGDSEAMGQFIDEAVEDGATAIGITVKDEAGLVYFKNNQAAQYQAQADKLINLKETSALISEKGLTPVAVMETFKDPIASRNKNNGYIYIDGASTWLDNSPSNGGKPWLNVYSESAQAYLIGLQEKVFKAGFKQIVLNSVQYPDVRDFSTIMFPKGESSRQDALLEFIQASQEKADEYGASVTVTYNAQSVAGQKENIYFGNPFDIGAERISPIIDSSVYTGKVKIGSMTIKNPARNLDKVLAAIAETVGPDTVITPVISKSDSEYQNIIDAINNIEGISGYMLIE